MTCRSERQHSPRPSSPSCPTADLHEWYRKIVSHGTGKKFVLDHNNRWLRESPLVEAFFHARYMLEMAVKYRWDASTVVSPGGRAAVPV